MVKHVVMFKLKDFPTENEKEQKLDQLFEMLDKLRNKIPQIKEYEVGKNMSSSASSFDLVLVSGFDSEEDLEVYRRHPEHVKVLDFIGKVKDILAVVDYTV
jgi:hypothetical protein